MIVEQKRDIEQTYTFRTATYRYLDKTLVRMEPSLSSAVELDDDKLSAYPMKRTETDSSINSRMWIPRIFSSIVRRDCRTIPYYVSAYLQQQPRVFPECSCKLTTLCVREVQLNRIQRRSNEKKKTVEKHCGVDHQLIEWRIHFVKPN